MKKNFILKILIFFLSNLYLSYGQDYWQIQSKLNLVESNSILKGDTDNIQFAKIDYDFFNNELKNLKALNSFNFSKKSVFFLNENKEFDVCTIFYNQFKNVITQIPQEQQIIPLKMTEDETNKSDESYEFEPDEDEILGNLLPKNISTQIFKAMLENSASEQGSRMSAMDNATRNAGEMVDKLTIEYNRSRQAAITKELIEIISGAESL